MKAIKDFNVSATDWRKQLRINERRTMIVMIVFVALYLLLGFFLDLMLVMSMDTMPVNQAAYALFTLQVYPLVTTIMGGVAIVALFATYSYHDRIMLSGTKYHEINPDTAQTSRERLLYNVVEEMKVAAGLRYMPKIYVIEANYMNAFASGMSEKSAMVAITRGLLKKLDRAELQAVMAHELSHIKHHDIKLTLTATVLANIMLLVIDFLFRGILFSRGRRSQGQAVAMVLILLVRMVLSVITLLLLLYLSRTREYMADAGAVKLMRDNEPMARALLKIDRDYKIHKKSYKTLFKASKNEQLRQAAYIFDPTRAGITEGFSMTGWSSTHPSTEDRLRALGYTAKVFDSSI